MLLSQAGCEPSTSPTRRTAKRIPVAASALRVRGQGGPGRGLKKSRCRFVVELKGRGKVRA